MPSPISSIHATNVAASAGRTNASLEVTGTFKPNPDVRAECLRLARRCKDGGASSIMFLPEQGLEYESFAFGYGTHLPKSMTLGREPKDGVVRGTIIINPSGHGSKASLERFAETNTYSVMVTLPNGQKLERSGISRNNPDQAEYATAIPIQFPYMSGVTKIEAWPDGSCRTGGYLEGRKYELYSADKPYDYDAQVRKAEAHECAHPEVRWGTPRESDDCKKHGVAPSPRPYDDW